MTTVTRHVGFCPVCQRDIKVREHTWGNATTMALVHHGYNRPGHGFIVGDCFGVHREPHELSPKLAEDWGRRVEISRAVVLGEIAALPRATVLPISPRSEQTIRRDDVEHQHTWGNAYEAMERHLARQLEDADREIARMRDLIDSWELLPLRDFEELEGHAQQARAERDAVVRATRTERLDKAVANFQKRIDAAVRNENAATLAEIWESAQRKLPDLGRSLKLDLSEEQALRMLDRDLVWQAFGLIDERGYRIDVTAWGGNRRMNLPPRDAEDRGEEQILRAMMNTRYAKERSSFDESARAHASSYASPPVMPWPEELS